MSTNQNKKIIYNSVTKDANTSLELKWNTLYKSNLVIIELI